MKHPWRCPEDVLRLSLPPESSSNHNCQEENQWHPKWATSPHHYCQNPWGGRRTGMSGSCQAECKFRWWRGMRVLLYVIVCVCVCDSGSDENGTGTWETTSDPNGTMLALLGSWRIYISVSTIFKNIFKSLLHSPRLQLLNKKICKKTNKN